MIFFCFAVTNFEFMFKETAMGTTANAQGDSESLYLKAVKE